MNVIVIIPARMNSTRFPNKPMKKIKGLPMIAHCFYRSCMAVGNNNVYVATCDQVIKKYIHTLKGNVVLTSNKHKRAVSRTSEALQKIEKRLNKRIDYIIMVQGDEPLVSPNSIKKMTKLFKNKKIEVVNLMTSFRNNKDFIDKNNVKVVTDKYNNALYFSREPIPSMWKNKSKNNNFMQTGIISFKRNSLINFEKLYETPLEKKESVDMNRLLEHNKKIKMCLSDNYTFGVDTPSELKIIEKLMNKDVFFKKYDKLSKTK